MRKFTFLALCILAAQLGFAQVSHILPLDEATGKVTFMEVVECGTLNPTEAFQVMRNWAVKNKFTEVTTEGTKGEYKGSIPVSYSNFNKSGFDNGTVTFAVHIMTKDGKYRYILTDFMHSAKNCEGGDLAPTAPPCPSSRMSQTGWTEVKKGTKMKIDAFVADLKKMVTEAQNDPTKKEDW